MFSGSWKEVVACLGFELTVPMSWAVLSSYDLEYGVGWGWGAVGRKLIAYIP